MALVSCTAKPGGPVSAEPSERARQRVADVTPGHAGRQYARPRHHEMTARDERLLVGRGHDLATPQRRQDGSEAHHPSCSHQHQVDVVGRGHVLERLWTVLGQRGQARGEARDLRIERFLVAPCRQRGHAEPLRERREDVECLPPD